MDIAAMRVGVCRASVAEQRRRHTPDSPSRRAIQWGHYAPVRYRVRWRTASGAERSRTFTRHDEAAPYRAQLEGDLIWASWIDPMLARVPLGDWAAQWRSTIVDLRPTSLGRLDSTLANHVLPQWGDTPLSAITNADGRAWAAAMRARGLSPSTVRKAVFALGQPRRHPQAPPRALAP